MKEYSTKVEKYKLVGNILKVFYDGKEHGAWSMEKEKKLHILSASSKYVIPEVAGDYPESRKNNR